MNFEHIRLFVAVYRAGNFASVASELGVAASSVSRAVATLESKLQTRLFQRTTRNLTPTLAGQRYFQRMEALVEEFDVAHNELLDQSTTPSGRIKVTASVSFGQIVIAPLLKEFHDLYPDIYIDLTLADTRSNIVAGQFDVAIRHGKLMDSSLVARKLRDVEYSLVASPDYLKQNPISVPEDISKHSLLSYNYNEFNREWRFRQNGQTQVIPIKPSFTFSTALTIQTCIREGMGLSLLANWLIEEDLKQRKLVKVLPAWEAAGANFDTAIWLVYPTRSFIPAKVSAFTDFLVGRIGNN